MTSVLLENDLLEKVREKWNEENPYETDIPITHIVRKLCIKYIENNKEVIKNGKKTVNQ